MYHWLLICVTVALFVASPSVAAPRGVEMQFTPSSGPVVSYFVEVAVNGSGFVADGTVEHDDALAEIIYNTTAETGSVVVYRVYGVADDGRASPPSATSVPKALGPAGGVVEITPPGLPIVIIVNPAP